MSHPAATGLSEERRRLVLARLKPAAARKPSIPKRPAGEPAPASFGQEQIWLHSELAPEVPLYTESLTVHCNGPLDAPALAGRFREIVRANEIWRTTFAWPDGQLVQRVHPYTGFDLPLVDLRSVPEGEREAAALREAAKDMAPPFDLRNEPGVRARLVTLSDRDHRLFLTLHHMVFDGISIYRVVLPQLATQASPAGPLQYADFAYWQRRTFEPRNLEGAIRYWKEQLNGAPAETTLPAGRPRPAVPSFRGGLLKFALPPDVAAAARATALAEHSTLFMLLLASFECALHASSGQTDLVLGSVSGGRDLPELETLVGYFLRMLPIRTSLAGDPTFREILGRVRGALLGALCHDGLPFQMLVRLLAPARELGRSPFYQVTFSIEPPLPSLGPEWDLGEMDVETGASKFDLSIELEDRGRVILGRAIYSTDLYERSTIASLVDRWAALLRRAAAAPQLRLGELVDA